MSKRSKSIAKPGLAQEADNGMGAWIPWEVAEAISPLNLRPASRWQVFMTIVLVWCRYGRREARLKVAELAEMTGLGERTVQVAITDLIRRGLIGRVGRYGRLRVTFAQPGTETGGAGTLALPNGDTPPRRRARTTARPTPKHVCASPTVYKFSSLVDGSNGSFTPKQRALVADVFAEASELLGSDVGELIMQGRHTEALGLRAGATYNDAITMVTRAEDRTLTRDFVQAVLALRRDERVQGTEVVPRCLGTA